ncbi:MAG: hypothetical protein EA388_08035 [Nitriliruptor sp.]|nr:MAG: hypothetical protein EA388_08035 [Nitriliruptor sp.]
MVVDVRRSEMSWTPRPQLPSPLVRCWIGSSPAAGLRAPGTTSAFILTRWLDWCHAHGYDPVDGADAAALETFIAELKAPGYAPNTIIGRVSAMSAFYRWCVREQLVVRNPVELIRRPAPDRIGDREPDPPPTHRLAGRRRGSWRCVVGGRDAARSQRAALRGADRLQRRGPRHPLLAPHPEADHHQGRSADRGRTRAAHHAGHRPRHRRTGPWPAAAQPGGTSHDRLQRAVPRWCARP